MLWQEYGVVVPDFEFQDMLQAMRLRALENQRQKYENDKLGKK